MRIVKGTKLILSFVILLFISQLFVSSKVSTIGNNIADLDKKAALLEQENRLLLNKIASVSALTYVEEKATEFGLNKKSEVLFLDDAVLVVKK